MYYRKKRKAKRAGMIFYLIYNMSRLHPFSCTQRKGIYDFAAVYAEDEMVAE